MHFSIVPIIYKKKKKKKKKNEPIPQNALFKLYPLYKKNLKN